MVLINKIGSADDDDEDGFNDGIEKNGKWKKVTYVGFETDYDDNMGTILFDLFDGVG